MMTQTGMKRISLAFVAISLATLTACAPQASVSEGEGSGGKATVAEPWSPESDCMTCHESEAASVGDNTTLYSLHSQHATMNACIDCHGEDPTALADAHADYQGEKARLPKKLSATYVSDAVCATQGCHDIAELIDSTPEALLTDTKGNSVNAHSMVVDEQHAVDGENGAGITCTSCHEMHAANGIDEAVVLDTAQTRCTACHHDNVFECYTCHD